MHTNSIHSIAFILIASDIETPSAKVFLQFKSVLNTDYLILKIANKKAL